MGAWKNAVLPAVSYWKEVGPKSCKVGDYTIKVGGVKAGVDASGKNVDTQIVFFGDRDKIVCHLYHTTQLILVNGHGYKRFINTFLKPFLQSKIGTCLEEIEVYNGEVLVTLGAKTVKRSAVKYKGGSSFPCNRCEFAAKNISALNKHKKIEHVISFNMSKKFEEPRQSTRNNSAIECLMLEDVTVTNISNTSENLEENAQKFTCEVCNFATITI